MGFKALVDAELQRQGKTFKWLVQQLDVSTDGLKAGLDNETIKLRDLKKLISVLNMPINTFFEGASFQSIRGDGNTQANHSNIAAEPEIKYRVVSLEEKVKLLESQLEDKERIISLLSEKRVK